jgi:hypothetical protein
MKKLTVGGRIDQLRFLLDIKMVTECETQKLEHQDFVQDMISIMKCAHENKFISIFKSTAKFRLDVCMGPYAPSPSPLLDPSL